MPIDTHVRAAAWLHIAMGVLVAGAFACAALFIAFFGAIVGATTEGAANAVLGWIAGLGIAMLLFLMVFPVLEIVGGALLLAGSPAGKAITILFSVLHLLNIPFGTAIGIYSMWALLREVPPQAGMAVEPGMRGY